MYGHAYPDFREVDWSPPLLLTPDLPRNNCSSRPQVLPALVNASGKCYLCLSQLMQGHADLCFIPIPETTGKGV